MSVLKIKPHHVDRVLRALKDAGEPCTVTRLIGFSKPVMNHTSIKRVLCDLEADGVVVRRSVVKFGSRFDVWGLAASAGKGSIPAALKSRVASANGATNGRVHEAAVPIHLPPARTDPSTPLNFFDAKKVAEDLLMGVESLKVLAESLNASIADWSSMTVRRLIEWHCQATGQDVRTFVFKEILPLLIDLDVAGS